MKSLTLLRHAKSGWDDPSARDFDRALNQRGERAGAMMGRHLRAEGLRFDHVVASPAVRVVQTIGCVALGYGEPIEPEWDRRIYLASAATLLDIVNALPDAFNRVLVVGHNPGLEDLALMLVPDAAPARGGEPSLRDEIETKYPTASLAQIDFDGARWRDVLAGAGNLVRFIRPRDLDPALGPDDD